MLRARALTPALRRVHLHAAPRRVTTCTMSRSLAGELFKYGGGGQHTAFRSGKHKRCLIHVGGLTDGLFACGYVDSLTSELDAEGWSVVQVVLSSSYMQFGLSSLDTDAEELNMLIDHLKERDGASQVVIAGHSTGCQDAVRYVQRYPGKLAGAILQAPVSDRECISMEASNAATLTLAEQMIAANEGESLMPRASFYAPITARRFQSLAGRLGDDDMFSSDFTDAEMEERLGHMSGTPTLVLMSGSDEYVPKSVDQHALAARYAKHLGSDTPQSLQVIIEEGNHSLNNELHLYGVAVQHMLSFVRSL